MEKMISFTLQPFYIQGKSPRCSLDKGLDGPQSLSEDSGKENHLLPMSGIDPHSSGVQI
jgi:hypothetical protein